MSMTKEEAIERLKGSLEILEGTPYMLLGGGPTDSKKGWVFCDMSIDNNALGNCLVEVMTENPKIIDTIQRAIDIVRPQKGNPYQSLLKEIKDVKVVNVDLNTGEGLDQFVDIMSFIDKKIVENTKDKENTNTQEPKKGNIFKRLFNDRKRKDK